jgi:formylmethanofuran dehydrogenase subunit E
MRRKLIDADEFTSELAKAYAEQSKTAGTWEKLITTQLLAIFSKDVIEVINALPTVDAEPVRHGKWTVTPIYIKCSECGESFMLMPQNYCPECGARMDEDDR